MESLRKRSRSDGDDTKDWETSREVFAKAEEQTVALKTCNVDSPESPINNAIIINQKNDLGPSSQQIPEINSTSAEKTSSNLEEVPIKLLKIATAKYYNQKTELTFSEASDAFMIRIISFHLVGKTITNPRCVACFKELADVGYIVDGNRNWPYGMVNCCIKVGNREVMKTAIIVESQKEDGGIWGVSLSGNDIRFSEDLAKTGYVLLTKLGEDGLIKIKLGAMKNGEHELNVERMDHEEIDCFKYI